MKYNCAEYNGKQIKGNRAAEESSEWSPFWTQRDGCRFDPLLFVSLAQSGNKSLRCCKSKPNNKPTKLYLKMMFSGNKFVRFLPFTNWSGNTSPVAVANDARWCEGIPPCKRTNNLTWYQTTKTSVNRFRIKFRSRKGNEHNYPKSQGYDTASNA
jgi:hypothetical protein